MRRPGVVRPTPGSGNGPFQDRQLKAASAWLIHNAPGSSGEVRRSCGPALTLRRVAASDPSQGRRAHRSCLAGMNAVHMLNPALSGQRTEPQGSRVISYRVLPGITTQGGRGPWLRWPLPCAAVRLPWRRSVRRRRRVFPEDVPGPWVSDRELRTAERVARETGEAVPTVRRGLRR